MRQALYQTVVKLYGGASLARPRVQIVMQEHQILKYTGRRA